MILSKICNVDITDGIYDYPFMPRKAKQKTVPVAPEAPAQEVGEMTKEKATDASQSLIIYGDNPLELVLPDQLPEADYLAYGVNIGRAMEFASWRIGDWVNFGMTKFGYKDYTKLAGVTGLAEGYLRTCSSVAGRVLPTLRGVASLERARLMLQAKNEKESVDHAFKRLGSKTTEQLRNLTRGAGTPRKPQLDTMSVDAFYKTCGELATYVNKLDKEKWPIVAGYENGENGGHMDALRGELTALLAAIKDVAPAGSNA